MEQSIHAAKQHTPWNKGKLVGQKAPLKLTDIWAIRVRLQIGGKVSLKHVIDSRARFDPGRTRSGAQAIKWRGGPAEWV
jgi:hypothetical protein